MATWSYPKPRKGDTVDDYHGVAVEDPYRWMEDPEGDETKRFVEQQNAISQPFLAGLPAREQFHKRMTELYNYPKYGAPFKRGSRYYYSYNSGLQNQSVLYVMSSLDSDPKVFFDPNTLSEDGTVSMGTYAFSKDGELFAYSLSDSGSDWKTIKVKTVSTGVDFSDELKMVKFTSIAWTYDGKGFFYQRYPENVVNQGGSETSQLHHQLMSYHHLGTLQSSDELCCRFPDHPDWMTSAQVTDDGRYLVVKIFRGAEPKNLLCYYDLANGVKSNLPLVYIVDEFDASYDVINNEGSLFTIMTNYDSPRYCLMTFDLSQATKDHWKVLVAEQDKDVLEDAMVVNAKQLVLLYLRDVKSVLEVHDLESGQLLYPIELDMGCITHLSGEKNQSEIFYLLQSFLVPGLIFRCDMSVNPTVPMLWRTVKLTGFVPEDYTTKQVFYPSNDGTAIPMFIVHKKDLVLDGTHPCLLYGYGGFNISITPYFSVSRIIFMQHLSGVFALANLRGGGEYGETWHQGGMFERKQNVFDDFHKAAEYLVESKYTSSNRLAIMGGSNGGLLVCACANQRPDLYRCVVSHVGVLDMLRYHKFTIGAAWVTEFGNPDTAKDFKSIYKYSPLHNIPSTVAGEYPAMLLLTGDHDDRVVPLHSLKFIATLQEAMGAFSQQPLMIRVDIKSGHGAGKPTSKVIAETSDVYSFIASTLSIKWVPNA